jgi:hypothetical protein
MITGFQFFKTYQTVNWHLLSKIDVLKYSGTPKNLTLDSYRLRDDRMRFESYANKINTEREAFYFCVSNFVHNNDKWIYDCFDDSNLVYKGWRKYFDAFSYNFKAECLTLENIKTAKGLMHDKLFVQTKSGGQPPLLQMLLHGLVTPEFVCTMEYHFKFFKSWNDLYSGIDPMVENTLSKLTNYVPLVKIIRMELK